MTAVWIVEERWMGHYDWRPTQPITGFVKRADGADAAARKKQEYFTLKFRARRYVPAPPSVRKLSKKRKARR